MKPRHDSRPLPIKLDSTSNGEFAPVPLDAVATHARSGAAAAVETAARRLGLSRRDYLVSTLGAAATLAAFDRAFAAAGRSGGRYVLPAEAPFELAAADAAIGGDDFIFDVQLHHVNPKGPWRRRASPFTFRSTPNSACSKTDHIECFSSDALLKEVFFDSDTAMGVLSHVAGGADENPLDFEAAGAMRAAANALDGTERLLLHGRCMPTLAGEVDGMDAQVARFPVTALKTYTQFGPRDGAAGFFLDDDRLLWGTDSIWYGSPQDQIQAFRAFQIAEALHDRHGYPALTPALKRKVFGLNAARVYGLQPDALRRKLRSDGVQRRKAEYLNDPQPSFPTYGPRDRAEFLAFRRWHGELP